VAAAGLATTVGAFVAAGAAPARAMCDGHQPILAPANGAELPPNPAIFLFVPVGRFGDAPKDAEGPDVEIRAGEELVPFTATRVPTGKGMVAYRLDVRRDLPGAFTVELPDAAPWRGGSTNNRYTINPVWQPPRKLAVGIRKTERSIREWTCSHEDATFLLPSVDAPVYRAEYATRADDYRRGITSTVVVPRNHRDFSIIRPGSPPRVGLGYMNCFGETLPSGPMYVGLAAVFPDGTVIPAADDPVLINPAPEYCCRSGSGGSAGRHWRWHFWALGAYGAWAAISRLLALRWFIQSR
jgi:hypothetical protein